MVLRLKPKHQYFENQTTELWKPNNDTLKSKHQHFETQTMFWWNFRLKLWFFQKFGAKSQRGRGGKRSVPPQMLLISFLGVKGQRGVRGSAVSPTNSSSYVMKFVHLFFSILMIILTKVVIFWKIKQIFSESWSKKPKGAWGEAQRPPTNTFFLFEDVWFIFFSFSSKFLIFLTFSITGILSWLSFILELICAVQHAQINSILMFIGLPSPARGPRD